MEQALTLTALAGMATAIGGAMVLTGKQRDSRFLSRALAFAAGVMLCVSFVELLPESLAGVAASMAAESSGELPAPGLSGLAPFALVAGAFLMEALLVAAIEAWLPEAPPASGGGGVNPGSAASGRMGLLIALSLAIHNFPEGAAVFVSNLDAIGTGDSGADAQYGGGLALAAAIAVHNIPEGAAVAIPVLHATGSRARALGIATLTGLTEPLGALLAWVALAPFMNELVLGLTFAAVAGMMVYISLDMLLPAAFARGAFPDSMASVSAGAVIMGAGFLAF